MCPIKPLMMGASLNDIPPAQLFLYLHATASYTVAHQLSTICKSQLRYRKSYQNNLMFCMKFHSLPQCHYTFLVACNLRKLMTRYINFIISLQTKWMMYWIVFALFQAVETLTDIFLAWQYTCLPGYHITPSIAPSLASLLRHYLVTTRESFMESSCQVVMVTLV